MTALGAYVGSAPTQAVVDSPGTARVGEVHALVALFSSNQQTVVGEMFTLAAYQSYNQQTVTAAMYVLTAYNATSQNFPRFGQLPTLVAYSTGLPDKTRSRAWIFDMDGHRFYVLDLGEEGTWLYDLTTQQWTRYETFGYEGLWNALGGVYWDANKHTIVSDRIDGRLYYIDPAETLDEQWRPIQYEVTGGVVARNRPFYSQDSFRLVVSSGYLGDPLGTTISLSFSDDQGTTWETMENITLEIDATFQEVAWRSLGSFSAPGRIFKVQDSGGPIRIDSATAEIEGLDDGSQS